VFLQLDWFTSSTLTEVFLLVLAFVLSTVIGVERQRKLKSAGLRTHALVGLGAAVFTLVSAYGFSSVVGSSVVLDPSRIAAQIVSGIGFIGAGVIFVRQNAVTGLTTAASIWVTAGIGMACGAGMPVLAVTATALHLGAVWGLGFLGRRLRTNPKERIVVVQYKDGTGALRALLSAAAELGHEAIVTDTRQIRRGKKVPRIQAVLRFNDGIESIEPLTDKFFAIPGVVSAVVEEPDSE